jgi:hypothetical protein
MSPSAIGFWAFLGVFAGLYIIVYLGTRNDREGMPPGAHGWIVFVAAIVGVLVAIVAAGH